MIDEKKVKHIAKLARIGITKKEEDKFQKDLSSILDYFNSLQELDVAGVEPTFHPTEFFLQKQVKIMREDKADPQPEILAEKLIEAAPDKEKRHIKVKAVF